MTTTPQQVGIWVDTQQARIVRLAEGAANLRILYSGIEGRVREPGQGKPEGRFGDQYLDPEKTRQRKHEHDLDQFAQTILGQLSGEEEVVIFGPAQMKERLRKAMETHPRFSGRTPAVVAADSMTDNQTIAWVKDYFSSAG